MEKINYEGKELYLPIYDIPFKAIFASEDGKDLLAALIRSVLDIPVKSGDDLKFYNTELSPDSMDGKSCRIDVRAKLPDGKQVHIEIQLEDKKNTIPRSVVYNSKMLSDQIKSGMDYKETAAAITLVITDFTLFKDSKNCYNTYKLRNAETNETLTDLIQITYLELPKYKHCLEDIPTLSNKEKWAMFLSAKDGEVLKMLASTDKNIEKAVKKLVYISEDEQIRYAMDMQLRAEIDRYNDMLFEKEEKERIQREAKEESERIQRQAREESERIQREAREETERLCKEAREVGMKAGLDQKAIDAARKLKAAGVDVKTIAACEGLSVEEVERL